MWLFACAGVIVLVAVCECVLLTCAEVIVGMRFHSILCEPRLWGQWNGFHWRVFASRVVSGHLGHVLSFTGQRRCCLWRWFCAPQVDSETWSSASALPSKSHYHSAGCVSVQCPLCSWRKVYVPNFVPRCGVPVRFLCGPPQLLVPYLPGTANQSTE